VKWRNQDVGQECDILGNLLQQLFVKLGEVENELVGELRPGQDEKEKDEEYV
jgi:hypothetical protein